jgi:hypothetical protein
MKIWFNAILAVALVLSSPALADERSDEITSDLILAAVAHCGKLGDFASACMGEVSGYVDSIESWNDLPQYPAAAKVCEPRAKEKTEKAGGTPVDVLMRFYKCVNAEI